MYANATVGGAFYQEAVASILESGLKWQKLIGRSSPIWLQKLLRFWRRGGRRRRRRDHVDSEHTFSICSLLWMKEATILFLMSQEQDLSSEMIDCWIVSGKQRINVRTETLKYLFSSLLDHWCDYSLSFLHLQHQNSLLFLGCYFLFFPDWMT